MILIFSEEIDQPTNDVIDWIRFYKHPYLRINYTDFFIKENVTIEVSLDKFILKIDNKCINFKDIKGVWFRRVPKRRNDLELPSEFKNLKQFIDREELELDYFLKMIFYSQTINTIGNPFIVNLNKIEQLHLASTFGLDIPHTIISSNNYEIKEFVKCHDSIVKPLSNIATFQINKSFYTSFTKSIKESDISDSVETPSLIQEKIQKKFEVRSFFLNKEVYSMAIFDSENSEDYRSNQYSSSLSTTKIKLPEYIYTKIIKMMASLELNCCSVDFLYCESRGFIFLEINPVGQLGFLSYPNNYNLEQKIAKRLCQIK